MTYKIYDNVVTIIFISHINKIRKSQFSPTFSFATIYIKCNIDGKYIDSYSIKKKIYTYCMGKPYSSKLILVTFTSCKNTKVKYSGILQAYKRTARGYI